MCTLAYDDAGNRTSQTVLTGGTGSTTNYTWDAQDRLTSVTMPNGNEHSYEYDYRTRRIGTGARTPTSANETRTSIVFSGGLSVAEYESTVPVNSPPSALGSSPTVEYTRGPDMGGGVGGLLYTSRSDSATSSRTVKYNLSNGRGDIVAQADSNATLTWTASYEAYGKRTKETGTNADKQRANSKDEDPTGLLNEGFRYRDIETGVWLSRDPAGFVDGPNLYAYVKENPWSGWDPDGLATKQQLWKQKRQLTKRRDAEAAEREKRGETKTVTHSSSDGESITMNTEYGAVMNAFNTAIDTVTSRIEAIDRAVDWQNGVVDAMGHLTGGKHPTFRLSRIQFDDEDPKNRIFLRNGDRARDLGNELKWTLLTAGAGKAFQIAGKSLKLMSAATETGASMNVNATRLARQLTSEEQLSQALIGKGEPMMGAATSKPLYQSTTERLAREYGGSPGDWAKMGGENSVLHGTTTPAGKNFEIHWYQNVNTGQNVEFKTKVLGH